MESPVNESEGVAASTVTFEQNGKWYTIRGFRGAVGYSLATGVGTIDARYFVPNQPPWQAAASH